MAIGATGTVTHPTVATAPNDPAKEVSSDAWNAAHTVAVELTGFGDSAEKDVGTGAGTVAAGDHTHDAAYEAKNANIQAHIASTANPHTVTKAQVGLANADNTSDAAKPISTATQTALDGKAATSHGTHVPDGGTTGQVLKKATDGNGDVEWSDDETSVGGGVDTANSPNANEFARFTDADTIEGRTAAETRTDLGLVIGTNVQAHSAVLDATTASFILADETKLDGIEALADVTDATNVDAAGAVMNADFNAHTILAATADNTPAALTVGEQTLVGRITAGNITALTAAQVITLLGAAAAPISQIAIKTVEASGDYTPTAGMKYCIGILTGSGGGGGGADSSTTTNDIGVGGGGGAGTTRIGFFTAAQIGASKAVVLNAGGSAGSATNGTNGGTPSDNTFGSTLLVAPGGLGGIGSGIAAEALNANLGGAGGGAGTGGVFGPEGGGGGAGIALTNDATTGDGSMGIGGAGGSSMWGGGGLGGALFSTTVGVAATSAGTNGKAYGSGGGGAVCSDTAAGAAGGAGKIGIFVAIEFI